MSVVIEADGLSRAYGTVHAVDRVDLRVAAGEVFALLGLNGAGKTTMIRMLLGMVRPTAGTVSVFGTSVTPSASHLWSRVGYLVEGPSAYPELTTRENLQVVARLRRLRGDKAVDEVIERLRLGDYADRRARTLSLGNLQRLGLAKALLHRPDLLILDEPANGLDPAGVVEIRELLAGMARDRGVTVFWSSHVLAEVARLATRVAVIHQGRLVEEFATTDLAQRVRRWVVVGATDLPRASRTLVEAGFHPLPPGTEGPVWNSRARGADPGDSAPPGAYGDGPAGDARLVLDDPRAVEHPDHVAALLAGAGCPPTHLVVEGEDLESHFLGVVASRPSGPETAGSGPETAGSGPETTGGDT